MPVAVLVFEVDPEIFLQPLIQAWPSSSGSAQTLLIERDGDSALYLSRLLFRDDTPMSLRLFREKDYAIPG